LLPSPMPASPPAPVVVKTAPVVPNVSEPAMERPVQFELNTSKSGRCRRDWNGSGCNLVRPTEFRDTGLLMQSGVTRNLGDRPRPETLTESYWSNCGESRSGNLQIERTALKSVQCRETGPRTETGAEPVGDGRKDTYGCLDGGFDQEKSPAQRQGRS
jgi:hypothetical protein